MRTAATVTVEKTIWRASSSPACCHMRPYNPYTRLLMRVTITTMSTKTPKCQPYSAGATWRQ